MKEQPNDVPPKNPENKISLEIAQDWAKHWRNDNSNFNFAKNKTKNKPKEKRIQIGVERVKGFFIPAIDLVEALIEIFDAGSLAELEQILLNSTDKNDGIRAYVGVEDLTNPKNPKSNNPEDLGSYTQKLMIVGVKNGKDILPGRTDNDSEIESLMDGSGGRVYDFSKPCPNFCDPNSPLI